MRRILIGLTLTLLVLPAWAQSRDEIWSRCGKTNNADRVIAACTAVIRSGRETTANLAIAYRNRGFAYQTKSGLLDQAIADASKAIALKPDYAQAYLDRANYYNGKGLQDEATADFTKAIALKPDNGLAYFDRAIFYGHNGLQDQAIADFTKAIALKTKPNPNSYVRLSPNFYIYRSYIGRAWAYHMKGEDAKALPDANKAVALAPTDEDSIETRAEIYEKLGQRDRAIADYRAALKLNPNDNDAQAGLKRLSAAQIQRDACPTVVLTNEIDQAIESCTNLIQSSRETTADLVRDYSNRAAAYDTARRYDEAIADYAKVIALAPDDAFNFEMRAGAYILKGLYDQAIADYTKAIALKPDAPDVYASRGSAYTYKRLYDQAIADYTRAIALKPDNGNYYASRALAYHFKGEDAQGLPDANKAVALLPKYDDVIENRAEIYEKLGRRDDAIADYRAALALNPNDKDAQAGLKRLGAAAVVPVYAGLTPAAATFLREIGIDPTSADVASIAKDDANGINLNSLAANRDAQGVKRFIAMRVFLHKFLIDSNTPYPPPDLYDVQYLTKAEQTLVANHIKKEFGVAPGQ